MLIDLEAIEELASRATQGPWVSSGGTGVDRDGVGARFEWVADCSTKENAAFIAAARELVPRLVAEVRARDTELAATRASEARLVVELAQRDTVIEAVRAIEVADRVDHSGHVGENGEPCGVPVSWKSRMGRDLARALKGATE